MRTTTTRVYRRGAAVAVGPDADPVAVLQSDSDTVIWVDLVDPEPDDLAPLTGQLALHPLAVADALSAHQRDKWIHYPGHVFVVAHAVHLDVAAGELGETEIDAFVGDRWVVTVHRASSDLTQRVREQAERIPELTGSGVGFLLYGLLAELADGYFAVLDQFEEYYDRAAEMVFADQPIEPEGQRGWFQMRRALTRFDRIVTPLHDGLSALVEWEVPGLPQAAEPYLLDVASEVRRVAVEVDGLRELVGHITDVNATLRDYRQNAVMKRVTSWAAIIAVPTLVTGFYGMNVPLPGDDTGWGLTAAVAVSLGVAAVLYVLFRRNDWL